MNGIKSALIVLLFMVINAQILLAQEYELSVQTDYSKNSSQGKAVGQFVDQIEEITEGAVKINMYYAAEIVGNYGSLSAVRYGALDCEMSRVSNYVGTDVGWQLAGDMTGGYASATEFLAWFYHDDGKEVVQANLYDNENAQVIGYWSLGPEALSSTKPLIGLENLNGWKFRPESKLASEIFESFGAKSVTLSNSEVYDALRNGMVEGADISTLWYNDSRGVYNNAKFAAYPGFHSVPAEHFSCNKELWRSFPDSIKVAIETAVMGLAFDLTLISERDNTMAAKKVLTEDITLHDWSAEDRNEFRKVAKGHWIRWGEETQAAKEILDSQLTYLEDLGLISE